MKKQVIILTVLFLLFTMTTYAGWDETRALLGSIFGSGGTTNTVAKFTGATSLGDSTITDSGTVVTVGDGSDPVVIASSNWDVDSSGGVTGVTSLNVTGTIDADGSLDWDASNGDELVTFDRTFSLSAEMESNIVTITDNLTMDTFSPTAYMLSLFRNNTVTGVADKMGGIKIELNDGPEFDVNSAGTAHALYINDDRTGAEASQTTEASVVIDSEGVYALNVIDGKTSLIATDINGNLDWNTANQYGKITEDAVFTKTGALDYDLHTITSTISSSGGNLTGYMLSLINANDVDTDGYMGMGGIEIVMPNDTNNNDISAPGVGHALFINDDRTGEENNIATEASVLIDTEGTHAMYVLGGQSYFAGTLTAASTFNTDGQVDIDMNLSTEEIAADATFTSTGARNYDLATITSTISSSGGNLTGYMLSLINANDVDTDGYMGMGGIEIVMPDDLNNNDIATSGVGHALSIIDDRAGAEHDETEEASLYINTVGNTAIYVDDGFIRLDDFVYMNSNVYTSALAQHAFNTASEYLNVYHSMPSSTGAADIDVQVITGDITHSGGNLTGYMLSLINTSDVDTDGYMGMGGIEIVMPDDANNNDIADQTIGRALYIDDNRVNNEASGATEASVVIDSEGTYAIYVADGDTYYEGVTVLNNDLNVDFSAKTEVATFDMVYEINGSAADFNIMTLTSTVTDASAHNLTGAILSLVDSNTIDAGGTDSQYFIECLEGAALRFGVEDDGTTTIGSVQYHSTTTTLTAAQVNGLRGAPISLVSGAANTWIEVVSIVITYDYAGAAFTLGADEDWVIEYADGTDLSNGIETTGFIDQGDDEIRTYVTTIPSDAGDVEAQINQDVRIFNTGSGETADGGTSEVDVTVVYRVFSTGF